MACEREIAQEETKVNKARKETSIAIKTPPPEKGGEKNLVVQKVPLKLGKNSRTSVIFKPQKNFIPRNKWNKISE